MKFSLTERILFDAILCVVAFLLPWWATLVVFFVAMVLIRSWYEGIVIAFFLDAVFSGSAQLGGFGFVVSVVAILLFLIAQLLRARLFFSLAR